MVILAAMAELVLLDHQVQLGEMVTLDKMDGRVPQVSNFFNGNLNFSPSLWICSVLLLDLEELGDICYHWYKWI